MATRATGQPPNRSGTYGGVGSSRAGVDVESDAVVRLAREDTRWFAVAVVILSLVLFLALPLAVLITVDHLAMKTRTKAEVRAEVQKMKELRKQIEEEMDSKKEK